MRYVVMPDTMKELDSRAASEAGIPSMVLMENAAAAAERVLEELHPAGRGWFVCGTGNNGGDGLALARRLHTRGRQVFVAVAGREERMSPDCRQNMNILMHAGISPVWIGDMEEWERFFNPQTGDFLVDGLFGTGLDRHLEGIYEEIVSAMNASELPILALDIPSGVFGASGQVEGEAIQAEATVTFEHMKPGLLLYPGRAYAGQLFVRPIGLFVQPEEGFDGRMWEAEDVASAIPPRTNNSHKNSYGSVGVIAGSLGMMGAGRLAALSALRAGAGLVTLACPRSLRPEAAYDREVMTWPCAEEDGSFGMTSLPDILAMAEGKDALVIGPGLGKNPSIRMLIRNILDNIQIPIILDADGLNQIAGDLKNLGGRSAPVVLTPHPGEMARLLSWKAAEVVMDPVAAVEALHQQTGATALIKGSTTVIKGRGIINYHMGGNPGMATAGSGDVLSGIIGALLARGLDGVKAACCGAFLHGLAGDLAAAELGMDAMIASDIIAHLPGAYQKLAEAYS